MRKRKQLSFLFDSNLIIQMEILVSKSGQQSSVSCTKCCQKVNTFVYLSLHPSHHFSMLAFSFLAFCWQQFDVMSNLRSTSLTRIVADFSSLFFKIFSIFTFLWPMPTYDFHFQFRANDFFYCFNQRRKSTYAHVFSVFPRIFYSGVRQMRIWYWDNQQIDVALASLVLPPFR